ncbi:MAG: hypothetical protein ABT940_07825 [Alphaproteobacteria bacterium]
MATSKLALAALFDNPALEAGAPILVTIATPGRTFMETFAGRNEAEDSSSEMTPHRIPRLGRHRRGK